MRRFQYGVRARKMRKGQTFLDNSKIASTHKMSYASVDGKWVAYPTIFENEDGSWTDLRNAKDFGALDEAVKRGETFEFDNEKDAKEFASEKAYWKPNPHKKKKIGKIISE